MVPNRTVTPKFLLLTYLNGILLFAAVGVCLRGMVVTHYFLPHALMQHKCIHRFLHVVMNLTNSDYFLTHPIDQQQHIVNFSG